MDDAMSDLVAHFEEWQGLRWLPIAGAGLLGAVATRALSAPSAWVAVIVGVGVVLWGMDGWVDGYYERHFGQVRGLPPRRLRNRFGRYVALVPVGAAAAVDLYFSLPFLLTGVMMGVILVVFWGATGRGRPHWLLLALLLFVVAVLPVVNQLPVRSGLTWLIVVFGAAEIVGGVLDHRVLVRRVREVRSRVQG